jgi:hypothetical protein
LHININEPHSFLYSPRVEIRNAKIKPYTACIRVLCIHRFNLILYTTVQTKLRLRRNTIPPDCLLNPGLKWSVEDKKKPRNQTLVTGGVRKLMGYTVMGSTGRLTNQSHGSDWGDGHHSVLIEARDRTAPILVPPERKAWSGGGRGPF